MGACCAVTTCGRLFLLFCCDFSANCCNSSIIFTCHKQIASTQMVWCCAKATCYYQAKHLLHVHPNKYGATAHLNLNLNFCAVGHVMFCYKAHLPQRHIAAEQTNTVTAFLLHSVSMFSISFNFYLYTNLINKFAGERCVTLLLLQACRLPLATCNIICTNKSLENLHKYNNINNSTTGKQILSTLPQTHTHTHTHTGTSFKQSQQSDC